MTTTTRRMLWVLALLLVIAVALTLTGTFSAAVSQYKGPQQSQYQPTPTR